MSQENIREELAGLGSTLPVEGREEGLHVPKGYFEQLEDRVLQRIAAEGIQRAPLKGTLRLSARQILSWAAVAAVLIGSIWLIRSSQPAASPTALPALTAEEAAAYLQEHPDLIRPEEWDAALIEEVDAAAAWDTSVSWELLLRDWTAEELEQLEL